MIFCFLFLIKKKEHIENEYNQPIEINQASYETMMLTDMTMMTEENTPNIRCEYWTMSDIDFQERLFIITKNDQRRQIKIKEWLEKDATLLSFIREHACLIAEFYLLKIELDLYRAYLNRTQSIVCWISRMYPELIQFNNIDARFPRTHIFVKKYLKIIEKQFYQVKKNLIDYVQHQEEHQISTLSSIDMSLLRAFIYTFVRQDQRQQNLYINMEHKKNLLSIYADDVQLVKEFYALKPNFVQVRIESNRIESSLPFPSIMMDLFNCFSNIMKIEFYLF